MRRPARPSPAMVVACLALLVATTGTGYATVINVPRASVGTPELKAGAVTAAKLRNGAVTTPKLRNGSVTLAKLAPSARVPGPAGPAGPPGPPGPPGAAGSSASIADGSITSAKLAPGAVVADKVSTTTASSTVAIAAGATGSAGATCPGGGKAVGGGASWIGVITAPQAAQLHIVQSYPSPPSQWGARGYNNTGSQRSLVVWAVCIRPE